MTKYLLQVRQVGDISGATNEEVGSRRDTQVRTSQLDSLTSDWTEVVMYFRATSCIESWFLGVVAEAAGGLFVVCVCSVFFFSWFVPPLLIFLAQAWEF